MASVQYIMYYRYVNPTTKKTVSNKTLDAYNLDTRFIKAYNQTDSADISQDIIIQESATNSKYDMLFIYDGIMQINSLLGSKLTPSTTIPSVYVEKFVRCKGEAWFVASYHASLQSVINAADPLVRALGKDNVRVHKNVAMDITVGLV